MRRRMPGTVWLVACLAAAAVGADWPRFRGPNADGISPETGIRKDWSVKPPALLWRLEMGDDGYAGPSVARGIVYIVDHSGENDIVRALDLQTGKERWRYAYPESSRNVYGFARATPTVASGRVYTLSREGRLLCLDAGSGRLLWQVHLRDDLKGVAPMWGYAAPPLVDGDRLIVWPGGKQGAMAVIDAATGKELMRGGEDDTPGYGMPVIATLAGRRQYVMTVWKGFVGVDASDGKVLWRIPWETRDGTNVACPIVIGNSVFITSSYDMGCALYDITAQGARERWRNKELRAHMNTPILWRGLIYGVGDPTHLVCLDPMTGTPRWKQPGFEKGGLVAVDGVLIGVNGSAGDVIMVKLNPERYEELGRFTPLGGQSWSPPVVAQGKLLVRNRKALACLSLK
ncbi:MAG: PQQ-binding-like beta-propeller repeat protein [Chthonomonadales bacterium]|nr:PQQ-binding-like beta-propeller repeat protein [Chthonomonadales bacterium]